MSQGMYPYNTMEKYKTILNYLTYNNPKINEYIGSPDEPSGNDILLKQINSTLEQIKLMLHTFSLVKTCFLYEANQYADTETLSPDEKADKKYCENRAHLLFRIIQSSVETKNYFRILTESMEKHQIAKQSPAYKAILKACQVQTDRHKRLRNNLLTEYISISMLRPYCILLQKQGSSLQADLRKHINMSEWIPYQTLEPILNDYAEEIAAAVTDSSTAYKDVRMEEAKKLQEKIEINKEQKQLLRQQKQLEKWKQQLTAFCIEKETSLHTHNDSQPTSHLQEQIYSRIFRELGQAYTDCRIICMLVKEPGQPRRFRYLTKNGMTNRITSVDLFIRQKTIPENLKARAFQYPNVKCIDTILLD